MDTNIVNKIVNKIPPSIYHYLIQTHSWIRDELARINEKRYLTARMRKIVEDENYFQIISASNKWDKVLKYAYVFRNIKLAEFTKRQVPYSMNWIIEGVYENGTEDLIDSIMENSDIHCEEYEITNNNSAHYKKYVIMDDNGIHYEGNAIIGACRGGHIEIVKFIIKRGGRVCEVDKYLQTLCRKDIIDLLKSTL